MIPISLTWETREKVILIKWNGFFSFGREKGKRVKTIFKIPIPYRSGAKRDKKTPFPQIRWIDLKEALSFLREWKLQKSGRNPFFPGSHGQWNTLWGLSAFGPKKDEKSETKG